MKIFITGGNGFIGKHLVEVLLKLGHSLNLLIRKPLSATNQFNFSSADQFNSIANSERVQIKIFNGSLLDIEILTEAMQGCEQVYHLAALAKVWTSNNSDYFINNAVGTENLLLAAQRVGINKILYASTAGTFGPSFKYRVTEKTIRQVDFFTSYESSKFIAEEICQRFVNKGLDVRIVNPSRVYGPGLLSESNAFTRLMYMYMHDKWNVLPGNGTQLGNYVYIEDVVSGMLLAMEKGIAGEKYLLGGEDLSYVDFFKTLSKLTGSLRKMRSIPLNLIIMKASFDVFIARIFHTQPLISPEWASKYQFDWAVSSEKAKYQLGYEYRSFSQGAAQTLKWLKMKDSLKAEVNSTMDGSSTILGPSTLGGNSTQ